MMEKKTVHRWFWVWDFEREEQWLNEMAQSGWALDRVGVCTYQFIACEPGEYTIRLEMHEYDETYIDFVRETGAEYVGRMIQWIYFRKRARDGEFDIFSDLDSRIQHLDRIGKVLSAVTIANLVIGIGNTLNPIHIGWINLLCATLLTYALGRIHGKKESLLLKRAVME